MKERPNSEIATSLSACGDHRLGTLAARLRSLQEGDFAVVDAVQIGTEAIPTLRELLFERDCAGVFQPRTRAVQALAALHAYDVLKEFLLEWMPPSDPVERLGDEAVVGAVANALATTDDEKTFAILFGVACNHPVPGVIRALGTYERVEAIPIFIESLLDDCAAEPARCSLRALGRHAVPALINAVSQPIVGIAGHETPSSIRRRRHALSLLVELSATSEHQERLRLLIHDEDDAIAALACRIGIVSSDCTWSRECANRLLGLLQRARWPLRREIEDCLIAHSAVAPALFEHILRLAEELPSRDLQAMRFVRSLRRILMAASIGNGGLS